MTRWRVVAWIALLALVAAPLAAPIGAGLLHFDLDGLPSFSRLALLAWNTTLYVGGTLALAMPVGLLAAILLYRMELPGRHIFRFLLVLTLFIPPSVVTTAWQATLAQGGWLFALLGIKVESPLLIRGMLPAILLSALCALPWIVWLLGQALGWVEADLEEEALLHAPPWRVIWCVTLPRTWASILAVALWLGIQTSTDVAITDLMQVRTFAEEVFLELWESRTGALERCVLLSLPQVLLTMGFLLVLLRYFNRTLPPLETLLRAPRLFPLGKGRWPWFLLVCLGFLLLAGVPLGSLLWKVGLQGTPAQWSLSVAGRHLLRAWQQKEFMTAGSLLVAGVGAALLSVIAVVLVWLMRGSKSLRWFSIVLLALAWTLPGPVVGIGLKELIQHLVQTFPYAIVKGPLYDGPSPLPVFWANLVRFLPCALAILWPIVRLLPRDLEESLRLDGASPGQQIRHLVFPMTRRFLLGAAVVVAGLSLGEVGAAAMRVETPGWTSFPHDLFNQLHYGVQNDVSALCLLLLGNLLVLGLAGRGFDLAYRAWLNRQMITAAPRPSPPERSGQLPR